MRRTYLILIFVLFYSCAGTRSHKHISTADGKKWYVTDMEDLRNESRNVHMYYVGSYENYHLIFCYDKIITYRRHYAVSEDEYSPHKVYEYSSTNPEEAESDWQRVFKK